MDESTWRRDACPHQSLSPASRGIRRRAGARHGDFEQLHGRGLRTILSPAGKIFACLLDLRNDVGLLSEEYDPQTQRLVGNFPQAFSHVGLINTACNLTTVGGPAEDRQKQ
jgi:hypothetical protein